MVVKVSTDLGVLDRTFAGVVQEFAAECQATFDDEVWNWPVTTRRRSGEVAGKTRDLVDTGELKRSQQPPAVIRLSARLSWSATHAAPVFLGAVARNRRASMPARNLPLYVAERFDWQRAFGRHFR